jgi:methyl-accepting chemotaxis protein/cytochrome b561
MSYPRPLRAVHWSIAILVTCQLAIAVVLTQLRSLGYGQMVLSLHRQLGLVILALVVARLVIGRRHRPPPAATDGLPSWQTTTAALVHRMFFVLLVVQPILGVFVAWGRGDALGLLGLVQLPAPFEISDTARERLMTAHSWTAMGLFALCVTHAGAVLFNRIVRRVSVLPRMLSPVPQDRLVNRVSVATQLLTAFGAVIAIALVMGVNAVATYRELNRATAAFQAGDAAVMDQLRSAQVAWKELVGLAASNVQTDSTRMRELADSAKSSLEEAQTHAGGDVAEALFAVVAAIPLAVPVEGAVLVEQLQAVDVKLQEIVDNQSIAAFQHRTDDEERAARGHDLIVVTVLPMLFAGLIAGFVLARSITGSLSRMSLLIRSIESDRRDMAVHVVGSGEFAGLTRDIVDMRMAVEQRGNAAAAQRAQFDAERVRLAEEQQEREVANERRQRDERQQRREQLAADFELQVAVIVDTVAQTAQQLIATAGTMKDSASATTDRSRAASSVAKRTSGTASLIATGTEELSQTAKSVRENAGRSKERAARAVEEAAAAKAQIDHLVAAARQISSITDVIAGVARQTNLLAINARVEAARAGDVGRGFSVVANEVKDLSNKTRDATQSIGQQIEQVNSAAARSSESLEKLREVIAGLEGAAAAIFTATDEQFASTRDIASRVSEISTSTGTVAQNIRDAEVIAGTTERMSVDVKHAADVMSDQAVGLREQVARFVLQLRSDGSARAERAPPQSAVRYAAAEKLDEVG